MAAVPQQHESNETNDTEKCELNDKLEINAKTKTQQIDPELEKLLDSVLDDFEEAPKTNPEGANAASSTTTPNISPGKSEHKTDAVIEQKNESSSKESRPTIPPSQEALFNELFGAEMGEEASKEFENALQDFMKDMGGAMEGKSPMTDFVKLISGDNFQASGSDDNKSGSSIDSEKLPKEAGDLSATLGETFQRLSQTAQQLQGDSFSEEDMLRSMGGLNLGGNGGAGPESMFFPMMQDMMQGLLSKDVLYPSLKEIVNKYPEWLENNKSSLEKSEYNRYSSQYKLMSRLCEIYESEEPSDDENVKQQRFLSVVELVQKMESLGQPPNELAGGMPLGIDLDESGLPKIPGMPSGEQCSIM